MTSPRDHKRRRFASVRRLPLTVHPLRPRVLLRSRSSVTLSKSAKIALGLLTALVVLSFSLLRYYFPPVAPLQSPRYLWSTPRSDGFNNQLISVYQALACAIQTNRTLVLPHFFENVRKDTSPSGPYPFEHYFDLGPLTTPDFRPLVTTPSILRRRHNGNVRRACYRGMVYYRGDITRHGHSVLKFYQRTMLHPLRPVNVSKSFIVFPRVLSHHEGSDDNNNEDDEETASLQCIDDSMCAMNSREQQQLGSYSNYSAHGQGYDIRTSAFFHSLRRRFQPAEPVRKLAAHWMRQIHISSSCDEFNAMHVRRSDYQEKCTSTPELCEEFGEDAIFQSAERLQQIMEQFTRKNIPVFVSTTTPQECKQLLNNGSVTGPKMVYMQDLDVPREMAWMNTRTDILALASQIVASYAREFVGNRFSSYTAEINYMRYVRNPNATLAFF